MPCEQFLQQIEISRSFLPPVSHREKRGKFQFVVKKCSQDICSYFDFASRSRTVCDYRNRNSLWNAIEFNAWIFVHRQSLWQMLESSVSGPPIGHWKNILWYMSSILAEFVYLRQALDYRLCYIHQYFQNCLHNRHIHHI